MNTQTTQINNINQLDKANATLREMYPNVSAEDRKAAIKDLGVTSTLIARYFNNKGRDLDTATNLIRFFKKRIENREKEFIV